MEPPADTTGLRSQIATLQEELDSLRARYDTLFEAHNRAAERYKADYKKWRDFKRWLFQEADTDEHVTSFLKREELIEYDKASTLGKRKQFEDLGPNVEHAEEEHHVNDSAVAKKSARNVKVEVNHSLPIAMTPRNQRRKSHHGDSSSHESLSPSPRSNKDLFLTPQSPKRGDKVSVLGHEAEILCEPRSSWSSTEPRKGRGRYAQVPSGMDAINSRFSIRKDRNCGMDFQYDAVVRNREERKHMLGSDCECCCDYYKAVGPLPPSGQPLWRSPTKRKSHHCFHPSDIDKENTDDTEKHKQLISRHRHHWHRAKTPPGYWDIGFPDTQEVLDINRRAAEMHRRKLVEVEVEAKSNNGRYVERLPKIP